MQVKRKAIPKPAFIPAGRMAAGLTAVLLAVILFSGTASGEAQPVKLMIVSDLHYLSPSLYESSVSLFENALKKGDGKMAQYSGELLEGLIQEVRHRQPDALIVSGDLSFNGEKISHMELAAAFEKLRAEGTDVWVIPGNHDVQYPYAGGYNGNRWEQVPNITVAEFAEIYGASMNLDQQGKSSMSYVVHMGDRLWLAMCDVCVYGPVPVSGGLYTEENSIWLQGVLEDAKAAGAQVITVTHQSLIPHTDFMLDSMTIAGGNRMAQQMRSSGIARLNLSGHLHIQHISEADGLYDIATGAWSMPPFRYGMLTVREDGSVEYEAGSLCEDHIPQGMARMAETWFEEIVIEKERPTLETLDISEQERGIMLDYSARLNHAYFSGDFVSTAAEWTEDPAYTLWRNIRGLDFFAQYLTDLPGSPENAHSALHLDLPGIGQ